MEADDKFLTWGVIGAGDVCEKKSVPAMYKLPKSRIKSVMRRDEVKAKEFASRHNIPEVYTDANKIFEDPEIDIVYISTPPSSHAELAIKAAKAGKAAYVEKPMARTYDECLQMISAFHKAKKPLYTAYYRRCLPNFLKIKELIESGAIGQIRMVRIEMFKPLSSVHASDYQNNWRVNPEISGGGFFYDLASHQLDFLDYILGPIIECKGFSSNQAGLYRAEDIVTAGFRFQNGVMGSGNWCFTTGSSSEKDETIILGSKGQIVYPSFGSSEVHLSRDVGKDEVFNYELPEHIQSNLIQTIINEHFGVRKCPSTGQSASRTNWVLESVL